MIDCSPGEARDKGLRANFMWMVLISKQKPFSSINCLGYGIYKQCKICIILFSKSIAVKCIIIIIVFHSDRLHLFTEKKIIDKTLKYKIKTKCSYFRQRILKNISKTIAKYLLNWT